MILFIVNDVADLKPERTTTRLMHACLHLGYSLAITDVFSMSIRSRDDVRAQAAVFRRPQATGDLCANAIKRARTEVNADELELVVIRTSPGRDLEHAWAHRLTLHAARLLRDRGVKVVNDPLGLERASSKLYAACLPDELTPRTMVAHSWDAITQFMHELGGPVVVKPLLGSNGRDVFFVRDDDRTNVRQTCDLLGRSGYLVVQEYIEGAVKGDKRVLLLDGEILTVDGQEAAVQRVPRAGEFRSNVSLGAEPRATELTDDERAAARTAASILLEDEIRFSGLDLVGGMILEVNVYSTGGLVDAERFYGVNYAGAVMRALMGAQSGNRSADATRPTTAIG